MFVVVPAVLEECGCLPLWLRETFPGQGGSANFLARGMEEGGGIRSLASPGLETDRCESVGAACCSSDASEGGGGSDLSSTALSF